MCWWDWPPPASTPTASPLVRKVLDVEHADLKTPREDLNGKSLGEALLAPTRIYVKAVKALLKAGVDVHAVSHITGGGFYENVPA